MDDDEHPLFMRPSRKGPDEITRLREENAKLREALGELVRVQDATGCVWRTSPIMDKIRAALANKQI